MPDTQITDEMVRLAAIAIAYTAGENIMWQAYVGQARAALQAALSGHVVVPRGDLSRVVEIAHRNECDPVTERLRAMIQAAPPVERG